jgi:signal transduction histidine kinase
VLAESDRGLAGTEPVRLDVLVNDVLNRFAEQAAERGVALRRLVTERTVPGDPVLLDRMISNLVGNAVKYNQPQGVVEVVVADTPALAVHNSGQRVPAHGSTRTTPTTVHGGGTGVPRPLMSIRRRVRFDVVTQAREGSPRRC